MSDIFVSYASEDRERIMPLVQALEKAGWSVFWDRTIPIGKTWREVVGSEVESCRSMIVVWSAMSVKSDWVLDEAESGKKRGILFPVLIDDVAQPYGFRSIQSANLVGWKGDPENYQFRRLITDLTGFINIPPAAGGTPKNRAEQEPQKVERLEKKPVGLKTPLWIIGGVSIVILAAVFLYWQQKVVTVPEKAHSPMATSDPSSTILKELRLSAVSKALNQKDQASRPRFNFTLSVHVPEQMVESISRVHYDLIYEQNPLALEGGPPPNFKAMYEGWGCYQNVVVTAYLNSPDGQISVNKKFDMCKVLEQENH
jgi:hypothetical protein